MGEIKRGSRGIFLAAVFVLLSACISVAAEESGVWDGNTYEQERGYGYTATEGSWIQKGENVYWQLPDGSILREGGFKRLNGKWYYLAGDDGRRLTGWVTYKGKKYYLSAETGEVTTGLARINGKTYYFLNTGTIPGEMKTGTAKIGGKQYFFSSDGTMYRGLKTIKGRTYYYQADGTAAKGWVTISGRRYYFNPTNFVARTGWMKSGGKKYYFLSDGSAAIGYITLNNKKYYFQKDGSMFTGWQTAGSRKYYYKQDGSRAVGLVAIGGKRYYFNTIWGYMVKGWVTANGSKYYMGKDGAAVRGPIKIGSRWYIFSKNGPMITDKRAFKCGGRYYRINKNGVAVEFTKKSEIITAKVLDRIGWTLRSAYDYARGMKHDNSAPDDVPPGWKSQVQYYAEFAYAKGYGHCYHHASIFYIMADLMGYKVQFVKGYVPNTDGNLVAHGWVQIYYNNEWLIVDPSFGRSEGRNGFLIKYGDKGTYRYTDSTVVEKNY